MRSPRLATRTRPWRLVGAVLVTLLMLSAGTACADPANDTQTLEQKVFQAVNAERAARGVSPVALASDLVRVARAHSEDCARRDVLSHRDSRGRSAGERLDEARIPWLRYGENVGLVKGYAQPVKTVVDAWLRSPGHAANLLDPSLAESAVGVARASDGTLYLTQVFVTR